MVGDVDPGHDGRTGSASSKGGEDPHRRGLAGPVGTEQPEDVSLRHAEIEPVEGLDFLVVLDEPFGPYHFVHVSPFIA